MQGILGVILLVLDVIAIIDIVKGSFTGGKKLLWILLIVFIPLVGLILYYVIGKKKA